MLETIKIKLLKLLLNNIFKYNQNETAITFPFNYDFGFFL